MKKEEVVDVLPKSETIYTKLWKAKQEIGKINKSANNPFFKSKYADLNTILDIVEPILHKHNLILLQPIEDGKVVSKIIDVENGDYLTSSIELVTINDIQKYGGQISYFRRYSLQSLLSLSMQDDDANEVTKYVKNTFPQERFESGLTKVSNGELTTEQFKNALKGYELTELQTKAMLLL
jgi:hypothetical protein